MIIRELIEMLQRVNDPEASVYFEDVNASSFCQSIVMDVEVMLGGDIIITNKIRKTST